MLRRDVLTGLLALASSPALAQATTAPADDAPDAILMLGDGSPFDASDIVDMARKLSQTPFQAVPDVPKEWTELTYEQYVSIWFDTRNALWTDEPDTPLRLDVFAPGLYFPRPVDIAVIEDGQTRPLLFDFDVFDKTDKFPKLPTGSNLGYSGLRLRAELEKAGIYQEFTVFQGASYFRAVGNGDIYGLSARGVAIDTGDPDGEEFPDFRAFWLEKPKKGETTFIVHALMDGPSITGAYRFEITPGAPLVMEVEATLFPRTELDAVGIAPLTSMFQFDETNRDRFSDFRPAVHDSDGLLIHNGAGETLWRPLANPKALQVSAFGDENPKGFGLMQRARKFSDFADLQAHYHKRPGVWIEPKGEWGKGAVTLFEIPTDREIYDNIVTMWRPAEPMAAGSEHALSYRLTWGQDSDFGNGLRVLNTRIGKAFEDGIIVAIDFEDGAGVPEDLDQIEKLISASAGKVSGGVLQRNPETGGPRLAFKFHPEEAGLIEFRAELRVDGKPLSETWLYRWTA
ncbi:glucan biosynthesis protein G [Planktotalea sp.]|uniref:glucan biosynthesis protein n=1 Tax=Planktotalea sp. TaxID=2029877 RepID=UPI003297FB1B